MPVREVPDYEARFWDGVRHRVALVVPTLNEGARLHRTLERAAVYAHDSLDVVVVDGGSGDGSVDVDRLRALGARGLLLKTGPGRLSAQLRCAYAFVLDQGYEAVVTIDGNDKDDPEALPAMLHALGTGYDLVQASRFLPGGRAENTPWLRTCGIRMIHAPALRIASGFNWTDTTQGFRAYSRTLLLDARVAPFRDCFSEYELLPYLSFRAPRLGLRCTEIPSRRSYPVGAVPTKITGFGGNYRVLRALYLACSGALNPEAERA